MKKLIVTLPAKDEANTLPQVIPRIKKVLASLNYLSEIVVVDDGSTDNTAAVCRSLGIACVSHSVTSGLAQTFRTEMKLCLGKQADIILHIDADGQYLPEEIPLLLNQIEGGYDLVLGSRFMGTIEKMPLLKRLGNIAFSKVISNIISHKITDGQTGFRAFTREIAQNIIIISNHTYTQEQIIKAIRSQYKVKEVPITFKKRVSGNSRLIKSPIEYAIRAWINLIRIYRDFEPLKFFGSIGLILFSLGFILGVWILFTFFTSGLVGGIPRVILALLFILTGIQVLLFGFLADMNKR